MCQVPEKSTSVPLWHRSFVIFRWILCHRGLNWICRITQHFPSPFHPRSRDGLLQATFYLKYNTLTWCKSLLGSTFHEEAKGNQLTCFQGHGPKPRHEPQQDPREAHLEAEQLLSLSAPCFTPPSVQHHPRSSSSGHGRVWHPIYHHAGHGARVGPSRPAGPPVEVQRFKREGERSERAGAERRVLWALLLPDRRQD